MSYYYDLILKKDWLNEYGLYKKDGSKIFTIRADNISSAYKDAEAFMSSWSSVRITTEEENEQKG
jgi:hypothetical protein